MARIPLFPTLALVCGMSLVDVAAQIYGPAQDLILASQDDKLLTGSADTNKPSDEKRPEAKEATAPFVSSGTEADILNRLQQRREILEQREKQLDLRESLLKAADQKLESRIEELRALEARLKQAEGQSQEAQSVKQLAIMYEAMKPKDAARVFERLDMGVLLPVAQIIPPRKLAEIMAVMAPTSAERLTIELARGPRAAGGTAANSAVPQPVAAPLPPGELPSITPSRAP